MGAKRKLRRRLEIIRELVGHGDGHSKLSKAFV